MLKAIGVLGMILAASAAMAQDTAIGNETPTAETAGKDAKAGAAAADEGGKKGEFKPPPGFLTKKRGNLVVYCKKDRETGTRFVTEKCFDEDQMREYLLALEIQKRDVDRIRATCTTAAVCSNQ